MSAIAVGKPTGTTPPLRSIRDITQEKNLMNVPSVEKHSAIIHHSVDTIKYTRGMPSKKMYKNRDLT